MRLRSFILAFVAVVALCFAVVPAVACTNARLSTCNNSGDDTANLQAAINAGDNTVIPVGTCLVTGLTLDDGDVITGSGSSSILKMKPIGVNASTPAIAVANNTQIKNIKIDGNRANQPAHSFSDSYNCSGGPYFTATCGGRGFKAGIRAESKSTVSVRNTEITATFGAAIATYETSNVLVSSNNIHDTNFEALYASGSTIPFHTVTAHDITVSDNTLATIGIFTGGGGCSPSCAESDSIVLSRVQTAKVAHNTLSGVDRCMVKIEGSTDITVDDNTASGGQVGYPGIQFQSESWPGLSGPPRVANTNITISNNRISGNGFQAGVQINSSSAVQSMAKNIDIFGNTITHTSIGVLTDGNTGLDNIKIHNNALNLIDGTLYSPHIAVYQNGGGINGFQSTLNTHDGVTMPTVTDATTITHHELN